MSGQAPEPELPALGEVPRTMLWTLHCRAHAAETGRLDDPVALRIARALGPELRRTFGAPDPCFAVRAELFDRILRRWLAAHPGATVVSLGEGLETQRHRVSGYGRWVTVDLPEAIAVRERFFPADDRHLHRASSAADLSWLDAVEPGAFVVAQGLLMYLDPGVVDRLLEAWAARVRSRAGSGALLFDVVPPWVARLSRFRVPMTPRFRMPVLPWGAGRASLRARIEAAVGVPEALDLHHLPLPSGPLPWAGSTWAAEVRLAP